MWMWHCPLGGYVSAYSPPKLKASRSQGASTTPHPTQKAVPRESPLPGLSGSLLSTELLSRPTAQRLQAEMNTIPGAQDQLGHLDG